MTLFWDAHYFLTSRVREATKLFGTRTEKQNTKAIVNGTTHAMLPLMIVKLIHKHGGAADTAVGFGAVLHHNPSRSRYRKVHVFKCVGMALHQCSKVPVLLGGTEFYDQHVKPAVE